MHQTFNTEDGVKVAVCTRASGNVRLSLDHPHFDIGRAEMRPEVALELAQALLKAGTMGAVQQFSRPGEGGGVSHPHNAVGGA